MKLTIALCLAFGLLGLTATAKEAQPLFKSGIVTPNTPGHTVAFDLPLNGAREVYLIARDGGDTFACDWANWIEPRLVGEKGTLALTSVTPKRAEVQWGQVGINKNAGGDRLRVAGKAIGDGIGVHANSVLVFDVPAGYTRLTGQAGLDNGGSDQGGSSVQFYIFGEKPPPMLLAMTPAGSAISREPSDAVSGLTTGEGLATTLYAAEPMLANPSNIDIDHRGRVWVCEVMNYRRFANKDYKDREEGDRILVLEDTNGDGMADQQTVFYQGRDIDSAHGVCVLGSRVIVSAGEHIFSFYDDNGDLKADRKEVMFSGISGTQHDHGIHAVVFGPDGKLYFNFGNSGKQLKDKDGKIVVDRSGREVTDQREPYQEGMVFRCHLDGSHVETLGWNFRNNWEVCVDSFGGLWQSDNDDDGNRGVRINFVMEYGNYGYRDEVTGAGWQAPRTNIEAEIPLRHWHLNDPGVVPNLLQTGAGSPTGICLYEGQLLPERFRNQIIHCDAGPNVVRAYPVQPSGAGYTATIDPVLTGTTDNWFRPSDVCVAPDGSLFVADWYDPGVGGHRQQDVERGRIFRVAPPQSPYAVPSIDLTTTAGAVAALRSPNHETRYLAWQKLHSDGPQAEAALAAVLKDDPEARQRARALWLLSKLPGKAGADYIEQAANDADVDLRQTAIRASRQLAGDFWPLWQRLAKDDSPAVRREVAVALAEIPAQEAKAIPVWVELATRYDGKDRWMLEALGIAATNRWDACLLGWQERVGFDWKKKPGRDILWRSRGNRTPDFLTELIADPITPAEELPRYFRSYDFSPANYRQVSLDRLLALAPVTKERQSMIAVEALARLPMNDKVSETRKQAMASALEETSGTREYLTLVGRLNLEQYYPNVLAMVIEAPESQLAVDGMMLLLDKKANSIIKSAALESAPAEAMAVIKALGNTLDLRSLEFLKPALALADHPEELRIEAVRALARTRSGGRFVLDMASDGKLESTGLSSAAAFALHTSAHDDIKKAAQEQFPLPESANSGKLPPVAEMLTQAGDVARGKTVFATTGTCAKCHVVLGEGKEVGPNLSEIGSKLSKEAMFESILYPSAGISHNYETYSVVMKNGTSLSGLLASQTDQEVAIKGSDALVRTVPKAEIEEMVKQPVSLMPADLQKTMSAQDLVDVISFMQTLKKK